MKKVQGKSIFTIDSINRGKPEIKPELEEEINRILEELSDGEIIFYKEN